MRTSILILFLLGSHVFTVEAFQQQDTIRVGYTGIHTENIDLRYSQEINQRYFRQISRIEWLQSIRIDLSDSVEADNLDEEYLRNWISPLADNQQLHYVIGGALRHISEDESPGFLNGRIFRYNPADDRFVFLNVRTAYLDLDRELLRFNDQLVQTVKPHEITSRTQQVTKWTLIVLGAAAVVSGGIYLYNSVGSSGNGGGPGPGPTPYY